MIYGGRDRKHLWGRMQTTRKVEIKELYAELWKCQEISFGVARVFAVTIATVQISIIQKSVFDKTTRGLKEHREG